MRLLDKLRSVRLLFQGLTFYQQFEYAIILVLTVLIVGVVTSATRYLSLTVHALLLTEGVDLADQHVFQSVFGMVFTVIIVTGRLERIDEHVDVFQVRIAAPLGRILAGFAIG